MDIKYKKMIDKIKRYDFLGEQGAYQKIADSVNDITDIKINKVPDKVVLSVIVPTYKRPQLLKKTIESIVSQEIDFDYEIVIVDNEGQESLQRSTTEDVVVHFENAPILYAQNRKNISSTDNWNMCLALARGKWICMVHDDDVLLPGCLKEMQKMLENNPHIEFLGCKNYSFSVEEDLISIKQENRARVKKIHYTEYMYGLPISLLGAFFLKTRAVEMGGFDEVSYMQDYPFVAKYAYLFGTYIYTKNLYGYRISMNQDSANNDMNFVRRVADYYLWESIAKRRTVLLRKIFLKNCQYNLLNRISEYNKDNKYGKQLYIDENQILCECEINKSSLHTVGYYFCKGIHSINMLIHRNFI